MIKLILWIVACILSTFGFVDLFYRVSGATKEVTFVKVFVFIIGVVIQTLIKFNSIAILNTISYFLFFPVMFFAIKPMKLKDIIFYVVIIWIYALFLDLILMLMVMLVSIFVSFDIYGFYAESAITISFAFVFLILARVKKVKIFTENLLAKFHELAYLDAFIIIFLTFASLVGIVIFFNLHDLNTNFLLYVILFLVVILFVVLIKYKINEDENKKYLETLKENNDFYIKMDDENRIFKHNLMAKLSSIKSVSNKKAIALIDDFVIKTNKNNKYFKRIKTVPYGLNGIIYKKTYSYLEDVNFKITNKIEFDIFKVLKPRRYNVLVEKLIVCLDNAIEASLNSRDKVVVINLYDDEDYIYIEVKNSFAHNVDIDNLGTVNYSTKGKKRGLGLFSALRDTEVSLNVKVVNNYFISLLSARKQK